jgi:hypothetical protein
VLQENTAQPYFYADQVRQMVQDFFLDTGHYELHSITDRERTIASGALIVNLRQACNSPERPAPA